MVEINEIKAGRLTPIEEAIVKFFYERLGDVKAFFLKSDGFRVMSSHYLFNDEDGTRFMFYEGEIIIDYDYLKSLNEYLIIDNFIDINYDGIIVKIMNIKINLYAITINDNEKNHNVVDLNPNMSIIDVYHFINERGW